VQVVSGAERRFLHASINSPGSQNDGVAFERSQLKRKLENRGGLGGLRRVRGRHFLADDAYKADEECITPWPGTELSRGASLRAWRGMCVCVCVWCARDATQSRAVWCGAAHRGVLRNPRVQHTIAHDSRLHVRAVRVAEEDNFNHLQSRCRMPVECAIGESSLTPTHRHTVAHSFRDRAMCTLALTCSYDAVVCVSQVGSSACGASSGGRCGSTTTRSVR
jgi:hypothetical protein